MKPILVGTHNPYSGRAEDALLPYPRSAAGNRLRTFLGMSDSEYLSTFDRFDLLEGRGRPWSRTEAEHRASELLELRAPLVLLGPKVAEAFGLKFQPFGTHELGKGVPVLVLPHPTPERAGDSDLDEEGNMIPAWLEEGAQDRGRELVAELLEMCEQLDDDVPPAPARNVQSPPEPPHEDPEDPGDDQEAAEPDPEADTPQPRPRARSGAKRTRKAAKKGTRRSR